MHPSNSPRILKGFVFWIAVKNKTKDGRFNLKKIISGAYDTDYVCGVQYGGYVCDGDSGGPMVCEDTDGKVEKL